MPKTSIVLVDNNRMVRDTLAAMLNRQPDMEVIGTDVAGSIDLVRAGPDVVLLDVGLCDQDSVQEAANLAAVSPDVRIIVMDLVPVNEEIVAFVSAGICGFVLKDNTFPDLLTTIRAVAAGEKVLPARMTESLFAQIAKEAMERNRDEVIEEIKLTAREREVMELLADGMSNKEIAHKLDIALDTAKSHLRNVMKKLALHTRLEVALYFHREVAQSEAA
ncbi:MAG: response regulator transcription factor [Gemmatimonadetes bacterium]|nr:response regulator transcription factor [Gemmatimonadota bacterium]